MTINEIKTIIALGEGFSSEFKKSASDKKSIDREICAFANATGGVLLIGVADDGEIVGVDHHNKLKSEIQSIVRSIEPPLVTEIHSIETLVVIVVPSQNAKPYSYAGKFYLRDGASSQQLSRNEIRAFFFKEGVIHFDEKNCDDYLIDTDLTEKDWVTIIFYRTTQEKLDTPSTRDFIIQTIQKNARATRNELAKTTGISANAVKQHIAKLKKDGILIRIGSTKAGHWKIRG